LICGHRISSYKFNTKNLLAPKRGYFLFYYFKGHNYSLLGKFFLFICAPLTKGKEKILKDSPKAVVKKYPYYKSRGILFSKGFIF